MAQIKGFVVAHRSVFVAFISQFPFQPKPAILQKLKKMHILEKVNSQSKQVQLVQNINMERDVRIHMGADAGIQEEPTFDHAEWDRLTRENFEKDWTLQMVDKRQENEAAFKAIQARSFEKAAMMALYGSDSLESF